MESTERAVQAVRRACVHDWRAVQRRYRNHHSQTMSGSASKRLRHEQVKSVLREGIQLAWADGVQHVQLCDPIRCAGITLPCRLETHEFGNQYRTRLYIPAWLGDVVREDERELWSAFTDTREEALAVHRKAWGSVPTGGVAAMFGVAKDRHAWAS